MNLPKFKLAKKTPNGEPLKYFNECMELDTNDCILWKYNISGNGYGCVWVNSKSTRVNRLALIKTAGEPPEDKPYALHSCHNRICFNPRHLRWGDNTENQADRIKDGTSDRGENCYRSKLTEEQVLSIRKDNRTNIEIANDYGVGRQTIYKIKIGKSWVCLTNNLMVKKENL
jgi:hypothetical protein